MKLNKLTLVIPAKDEEESLPIVLKELEKFNVKKIVVMPEEDKKTFEAIKNLDCKILFQRKKGF